jgi:hypothetical protein
MSKQNSALTVGRRTSLGLEVATKEGTGEAGGYAFLGAAALMSAAALPMMVSGRAQADEAAAIATLRNIHTAELEFRADRHDDLDRDTDFQEEVRNAARSLVAAVRQLRCGELKQPDAGLREPRLK